MRLSIPRLQVKLQGIYPDVAVAGETDGPEWADRAMAGGRSLSFSTRLPGWMEERLPHLRQSLSLCIRLMARKRPSSPHLRQSLSGPPSMGCHHVSNMLLVIADTALARDELGMEFHWYKC